MGSYTCNLCGTRFDTTSKQLPPGRSSRWSCAACGDDFCFDCRAEQNVAPVECGRAPAEAADDIGEYGLVTAPDAAASPARHGGADTRSATPSAPIVRCGLGFRLCHSSLGKLSIDSVLPGGAAALDGRLLAGDQILSINGDSMNNLVDAADVAQSLVGPEGSSVNLLALRPGAGEPPFEVTLERRLFDGQFDSIHSGPTPRLAPPADPDERPRSMPIAGSVLQAETTAEHLGVSGPLSAPPGSSRAGKLLTLDDLLDTPSAAAKTGDHAESGFKVSGPPKPESPNSPESPSNRSLDLQERLDRAIRRRSQPLEALEPIKPTSPARSETPIEELLAKYTAGPARSAPPPIAPTRDDSESVAAADVSEDSEAKDRSMRLVCYHCQRPYSPADVDSESPALPGHNRCAECTSMLLGPMDTVSRTVPDSSSTLQEQFAGAAPEHADSTGPGSTAADLDGRESHLGPAEAAQEAADVAAVAEAVVELEVDTGGGETSAVEEQESRPDMTADLAGAVTALQGGPGVDGDEDEQSQPTPPAQPLTAPAVLRSSAMGAGDPPAKDETSPVAGDESLEPATASHGAAPLTRPPNLAMEQTKEVARPAEQILRKGWLAKESGSGLKSMFIKSQKRWCVLKTGYFQYFHSQTEDGRSEVISLGSMEAVSIETKKNVPFLVIKTPQRSFTFCSPDKSSTTTVFEWLQEITKALIDVPQASAHPQPTSPQVAAPVPSASGVPEAPSPSAPGTRPAQAVSAAPMLTTRAVSETAQQWVPPGHEAPPNANSVPPMATGHSGTHYPAARGMPPLAQQWGRAPGAETQMGPIMDTENEYDKYSSMYEHEALATRTGILISADISPSMAAMTVSEIDEPPPMRAH